MTCFVAILIWISYIFGSFFCEAASCFQLIGGAQHNEGFLQINVTNAWKYVCLNDDLNDKDIRREICYPIRSQTKAVAKIKEPLLYENKPGKQLSLCSSNWLETKYCYTGKVVGIHCFLKYNDNQNVSRAWTNLCKTNTSYSVTTANKLNMCLRTIHTQPDTTYALIEGDNCEWTKEITCDEKARTFQLVENNNASMDNLHCVTVEVQNGTSNFSIAHCSSYLPAVCLEVEQEIDMESKSLTTPSSNEKESVWSQYVILASVPLVFLIFILVLIACYHIRKSRKRLIERQRPSSVQNHTYGRGEIVEESTEETYNIINDCELKDFKPELPARGQNNQILVLDDYSMPPDSIPQKTETDEYFVTNDDLIRSLAA
ncbi:hypothetical protein MAR_020042 [Mya arenaria]|uniref:SRCR domain-containing protein n=1 Tax=Mya arenaria TaxID=6604 RepID=A0ABY7E7E1_MYAAR|nr:hypothetical protein MAR_020042 [Mya arenaria]